MEALRGIISDFVTRAMGTFGPDSPYGVPSMCGALVFALGWFVWRRRARGRTSNLRTFLRALFPRRVWLHPSTLTDFWLWSLNTFVFAAGYAWLVVGGFFWRDRLLGALGAPLAVHVPSGLALLATTLAELLAFEFAYWASHYAFHRLPALWEFHKVHHSAEVMTTLTEMRQHPVEILVFVNVIALCTGLTFGLMTWVFGPGVGHITLLNGNIVLAVFMLTWGHLRHSHLWIPFRGAMGRLFQSPAHHQVHHSTDPRHFDRNLGYALAVWDWVFGTLHVPSAQREVTQFGVGAEYEDYANAGRSLWRPFGKAADTLRPAPLSEVKAP